MNDRTQSFIHSDVPLAHAALAGWLGSGPGVLVIDDDVDTLVVANDATFGAEVIVETKPLPAKVGRAIRPVAEDAIIQVENDLGPGPAARLRAALEADGLLYEREPDGCSQGM